MNIGDLYVELGQTDKALDYYKRALDNENSQFESGEIEELEHLTNSYALGYIHYLTEDYDNALEYYKEYLEFSRKNKLKGDQGDAYVGMGNVYLAQNNYKEAISNYKKAQKIYNKIGVKAIVELELGSAYQYLDRFEDAITIFNNMFLETTRTRKLGNLAITTNKLMTYWKDLNKPNLAIYYGKQSVNLFQKIRTNIVGMDREIKKTFLKSKEDVYRDLAALLIEEKRLPEALRIMEMLKEEEYSDYIKKRGGSAEQLNKEVEYTPLEQMWLTRYKEIGDKLSAVWIEHNKLSIKTKTTDLSGEEEKQLENLGSELKGLKKSLKEFLVKLEKEFSNEKYTKEYKNTLNKTSDIQTKLKKLDKGTVVIYTLVNRDKYYSILVSSDIHEPYIHPINKEDLNKKINEFRGKLREPALPPKDTAHELYNILLGDLKEQIKIIKPTTVMWSLDGALRYIPMSALHNGEKYLIEEDYTNAVYTPVVDRWFEDKSNDKWKVPVHNSLWLLDIHQNLMLLYLCLII